MEKKPFFWQREKEYYRFPLWMRLSGGLLKILWGAAKIAMGAALAALAIVCIAGGVFAVYMGDYLQEEVIPNAGYSLDGMELDQTSFIYYIDNSDSENPSIVLQQKIYTDTDRIWLTYEEIPEDLIHAAVAIEDKRFFQHQGVDWVTTVKACLNMFMGSRSTFGGSTITQQLIKNLSEDDDVTVRRKVTEIFRALNFEEQYDKELVMEWYLNTIYLGKNCYGVQSASRKYFGKDAKDLTTAECASLIGITNNPSLYDPYISSTRNRNRQLIILAEMRDQGYITDAEYAVAKDQQMIFTSVDLSDELYTCPTCGHIGSRDAYKYDKDEEVYHCPQCQTIIEITEEKVEDYYSYMEDTVIRDVCEDLMSKYGYTEEVAMRLIKTGGYSIYCTIDMEVQQLVDSIYTDLSQIPETKSAQQAQSAIVVIDNRTGDVVAMAGGVGQKENYLGLNRADQSKLQPGSAIKPISVYGPALQNETITPATPVFDGPLYDEYPKNFDRVYSGMTLVQEGVSRSMNTVACRVLDEIGVEYSFDFARNKFGLSTLVENVTINGQEKTDMDLAPLAMGAPTYGVTVRELAAAYCTYTNGGVWREARTYTKVLDAAGQVVLENTQDSKTILGSKAVNYMNSMLCYAVQSGTAYPARISGMTVAGKTGTTSGDRDRWFAGYTGHYTAVVWFGYDQPETVRLKGSSVNPALRLWKAVMEPLHEGLEDIKLYDSSKMRNVSICSESGLLATDACRADVRGSCAMSVRLYKEDIPEDECTMHVMVDYCEGGKCPAGLFCHLAIGNKVTSKSMVKLTEEMLELYEEAKIKVDEFYYDEEAGTCPVHALFSDPEPEPDPNPVPVD